MSQSLSLRLLPFPGDVRHPVRAQQTDLAPTLAVGLGLPIPKHSVGSLLSPVVQGRALREQLRLLHLNAVQLSRLLQENVPLHGRGESPLVANVGRHLPVLPPKHSIGPWADYVSALRTLSPTVSNTHSYDDLNQTLPLFYSFNKCGNFFTEAIRAPETQQHGAVPLRSLPPRAEAQSAVSVTW